MKEHPDLTYEEASKNLGVSISSLHRWIKAYLSTKSNDDILLINYLNGLDVIYIKLLS